jgi:hypothetical protein
MCTENHVCFGTHVRTRTFVRTVHVYHGTYHGTRIRTRVQCVVRTISTPFVPYQVVPWYQWYHGHVYHMVCHTNGTNGTWDFTTGVVVHVMPYHWY